MSRIGFIVHSVRFPLQASAQEGQRFIVLGQWSELASNFHIVLIARQLRAVVQVLITAEKCEIISVDHAPYLVHGVVEHAWR